MNELLITEGIDAAVKLITVLVNATDAQAAVSAIIAARVADGGRDWTDAERAQITEAVASSKAYAEKQAALPDDSHFQ
jgi:hypothetical protein